MLGFAGVVQPEQMTHTLGRKTIFAALYTTRSQTYRILP